MIDRRISQLDDHFVKTDLEQMSRAVNYLEYQYEMIKPYLGRRIFEIGTGIGNLTDRILPDAELVVGLEPNKNCYHELSSRYGGKDSLVLINETLEECRIEDLEINNFDTVLCVNVLEHIENDEAAVQAFYKVLVPEGRLLLVVPSPAWAYGVIDRAVGHFRRYSKARIAEIVKKAGFTVEYYRFFNPIGLIGWIVNSKISGRVKQSDKQIYIFDRIIVPIQNFIEKKLKFPVGQSLLLVAAKR